MPYTLSKMPAFGYRDRYCKLKGWARNERLSFYVFRAQCSPACKRDALKKLQFVGRCCGIIPLNNSRQIAHTGFLFSVYNTYRIKEYKFCTSYSEIPFCAYPQQAEFQPPFIQVEWDLIVYKTFMASDPGLRHYTFCSTDVFKAVLLLMKYQ